MPGTRRASFAIAFPLVVAACASGIAAGPSGGTDGPPATLTVYAAASLKGVLDKAATAWMAAVPGTTVTISTDSSAALEAQIEQGAPADVFLSADTVSPQKLVEKGLAAGAVVAFAGNTLTVIVPASNAAGIRSPADLAKPGIRVIAAGDAVPISKYAATLIDNLAKEPGYPVDFAAKVGSNVVSREDNVKAVVAKVELGEGDAGIVYVTDAKASTKVATIDVPASANVPATYAGIVVKGAANGAAGRAFLDWLVGPDGRAILAGSGFLPPP